jgi:hypothetical protein
VESARLGSHSNGGGDVGPIAAANIPLDIFFRCYDRQSPEWHRCCPPTRQLKRFLLLQSRANIKTGCSAFFSANNVYEILIAHFSGQLCQTLARGHW